MISLSTVAKLITKIAIFFCKTRTRFSDTVIVQDENAEQGLTEDNVIVEIKRVKWQRTCVLPMDRCVLLCLSIHLILADSNVKLQF